MDDVDDARTMVHTTRVASPTFAPPYRAAVDTVELLRTRGFAVLDAQATSTLTGVPLDELDALQPSWNDLPPTAI